MSQDQHPTPTDEFAGRVVLVTGSSSGIGQRCAERFAELGARIVVNSATSVEAGQSVAANLNERFGVDTMYVQADISDADRSRSMIDEVVDRFGGLDVLINNAGWTVPIDHDDLDGLSDDVFRRVFDVNVFGTWVVTKAALPHLQRSDDAAVVNITSIAGIRPVGSSVAYAMSKAALNHMTALLAKSFGPVRINAVAPGLVATPWTADWDEQHAAVAQRAPIPRSATPEDCAEAVVGIVRNRYMTGAVVVVDGGLTLRM